MVGGCNGLLNSMFVLLVTGAKVSSKRMVMRHSQTESFTREDSQRKKNAKGTDFSNIAMVYAKSDNGKMTNGTETDG